ncbi:MAG: hypothetical protein HN704_17680 [Bacteroidetes bacterium]|jgi:hypothetical protein|nr:hypothetical protein [Bacteroidota bacterium]
MEFKITVLPQETKEEIQKFEVSDISTIKDVDSKDVKVISRVQIYTENDLQENINRLNAEIEARKADILYYKEIQSQIK